MLCCRRPNSWLPAHFDWAAMALLVSPMPAVLATHSFSRFESSSYAFVSMILEQKRDCSMPVQVSVG